MKAAGRNRNKADRPSPGETGPSKRRMARNREARAVQADGTRQIAGLIAEGDFQDARRMFAHLVSGPTGDPRAKISAEADAPSLVRPIFVCGLHRSGTTLLVDHLKAHFELAWLQNIRVPEGEGQFVQDVYPQERPFGGPGSFALAPQMRLRGVSDEVSAREQADRLAACWGGHSGGGSRLLEKSPSNITRIAYLRSLFPDARFIVWMRDPRAVSLATRKWRKRTDLMTLMLHWNAAYLAAFEDLAEDCIIARYEDFCADPAGELERIASFCDLERREAPLPSQGRFEEVRNSNAKYVAEFPPQAQRIPGVAAWELFGYDLGAEPDVSGGQQEAAMSPVSENDPDDAPGVESRDVSAVRHAAEKYADEASRAEPKHKRRSAPQTAGASKQRGQHDLAKTSADT